MIIYYSGSGGSSAGGVTVGEPETTLEGANLMMSYRLISEGHQRQEQRWPEVLESRRRESKVAVKPRT